MNGMQSFTNLLWLYDDLSATGLLNIHTTEALGWTWWVHNMTQVTEWSMFAGYLAKCYERAHVPYKLRWLAFEMRRVHAISRV